MFTNFYPAIDKSNILFYHTCIRIQILNSGFVQLRPLFNGLAVLEQEVGEAQKLDPLAARRPVMTRPGVTALHPPARPAS